MLRQAWWTVSTSIVCALLITAHAPARATDAEIDRLLRSPVGKDWVTNGGNLTNNRYSTLKQIDTTNVGKLKGAWMTRLKGSGVGGKYSFEASPLVKDGIMYVVTGNDDVFALNAKTGEIIWEYWSGIDQAISTICCGWVNRGLAMGDGQIYLGQLDANVVALDMKTGKVAWKTPIEKWQNGYGITSAPLYYDGMIYTGMTGGEFGVRGRLTALDAKTGQELLRFQTGFGADAPPVVYEVDGEQFIAIATGGNQLQGSAYGDAVWTFSLKGQLSPLWPPPPPQTVAGPTGPIAAGVDAIKIGANNTEYSFAPARTRIKSGTTVSFTNVGDIPHDASALQQEGWSTGALAKGETKAVTFSKPGIYYYICTPHPWMYGQVIVE